LDPDTAATLAALVPDGVTRVGLFVDPDDTLLEKVLARVPLDLVQLHGDESPERCREIRQGTGLPVMKVIKVANAADIESAHAYTGAVDWLMFDAKAPKEMTNALPGGNALAFDWTLLSAHQWPVPWMLAGGLSADNITEAVRASGAAIVDVSSGVEVAPGRKDPDRIRTFLEEVGSL
ncbi:MAG: phosphoribosylanthranilate isomerase, partial [Alphaproteobacteria bacterium]